MYDNFSIILLNLLKEYYRIFLLLPARDFSQTDNKKGQIGGIFQTVVERPLREVSHNLLSMSDFKG